MIKRFIKKITDIICCIYTRLWCVKNRTVYKSGFRVGVGVKKDFHISLVVGENTKIGHHTNLSGNGKIILGNYTSIGPFSTIYAEKQGGVTFGEYVNVAQNLYVIDSDHDVSPGLMMGKPLVASPITIGNNVWLAYHTTILKGVNIGDNCVVGACSVVTKDIESDTIAAGVPAREIRKR